MTGLSRAHATGKIAKLGVPLRLGGKMKAEDTKKSSKEHQNQGSKKDGRETRLASALRTNLQKRKKQKRARASCEDPENTS